MPPELTAILIAGLTTVANIFMFFLNRRASRLAHTQNRSATLFHGALDQTQQFATAFSKFAIVARGQPDLNNLNVEELFDQLPTIAAFTTHVGDTYPELIAPSARSSLAVHRPSATTPTQMPFQ